MRIYVLGIGGTLMGSLAILAKAQGHTVSGSDKALYPPMSTQLADAGITVHEGFDPKQLKPAPDLVLMGNAGLPRGHPGVEHVLEGTTPWLSGAEWLGRHVLADRWVVAVAGTHGKTTTSSMVAHILRSAGLDPGWLIGGVPHDLPASAHLGKAPFFVVEADEYDTSYFDRRAKFLHYHPRTLVLNNLEYDHADIYPDLAAIQRQFHQLLRTVPGTGRIIAPARDEHLNQVLQMGCWSELERLATAKQPPRKRDLVSADSGVFWHARANRADCSTFQVLQNDAEQGQIDWGHTGRHNMHNALAAMAAARHCGVPVDQGIEALNAFRGVRRRMELLASLGEAPNQVHLYDDFAHHPTAIRTTLEGLRARVGGDEVIALVEPRSHTMGLGTLRDDLATCCAAADRVWWYKPPSLQWDLHAFARTCVVPARVADSMEQLLKEVSALPPPGNHHARHIVIMSNGSFDGVHGKLRAVLEGG